VTINQLFYLLLYDPYFFFPSSLYSKILACKSYSTNLSINKDYVCMYMYVCVIYFALFVRSILQPMDSCLYNSTTTITQTAKITVVAVVTPSGFLVIALMTVIIHLRFG
jgi:hypothetical protein